jgi:uncharacterized protein (DUF2249 family)
MSTAAQSTTLDVRALAPRERHPLIFTTFRNLPAGGTMQLVNDHDPKPLYYQFQAEMPGTFSWDYLESGPDTWRVSITRVGEAQKPPQERGCCGSCGGG